ncbi:hypothetical protein RRG08_002744 [Elysia crispata]|uniref:Uncharacterized protein n=1 Tax=Elysia crispata TaxID=231223 RepID=A0AAE0XTZ4_9GAST|nr:hypothetical protein RRG08_002744 [Elysia crispata]
MARIPSAESHERNIKATHPQQATDMGTQFISHRPRRTSVLQVGSSEVLILDRDPTRETHSHRARRHKKVFKSQPDRERLINYLSSPTRRVYQISRSLPLYALYKRAVGCPVSPASRGVTIPA